MVHEHTGYYLPTPLVYSGDIGDRWNHIVVTIKDNNSELLYLNGELVRVGEATSKIKVLGLSTNGYWRTGENPGIGGGEYGNFKGALDDLRIYNRALSAEEVKVLYDGTSLPQPVGAWTVTKYNLTEDVFNGRSLSEIETCVVEAIGNRSIWDGEPVTQTYDKIALGYELGYSRDVKFRNDMVDFPGGGSNHFVVDARASIYVPEAGDWTFACGCDDVFSATIRGMNVLQEFHSTKDGSMSTDLMTVNFLSAGFYNVRILHLNGWNEAGLEFSVAKGRYASFDSSTFKLVGDPASGIIVVNTTERMGVNDVVAEPQSGKVTLTYKVVGNMATDVPAGTTPTLVVTAHDTATGKTVTSVTSALSGDTDCAEGEHRVVWDMAKQDVSVNGGKVVFMVSYVYESPYCVIDLSAGVDAVSYPVSYLDEVPEGGWTDEYKTSKLVLKKIASGSFTVDEVDYDVGDEPYVVATHIVSLTKPFYMGVFEVTQKQYELVTGQNSFRFKDDTRPVERVSWDDIRGNSRVHDWPRIKTVDGNSFVGRLRARTGISVDLPTAAQSEYVFRADDIDRAEDLTELGRTPNNVNDGRGGYGEHTEVGSYRPNSWGIYDMYGNVSEWVLDWWWHVDKDETDPVGTISGDDCMGRMFCGTSWYGSWEYGYMNVSGNGTDSDYRISDLGFRLAGGVPEGTVTGRVICSDDSELVETVPIYTFFTGYKMTVDVKLKGYTAKGLPSGLKYDAKKGVVSGMVKEGGEYEATFTKKGEDDETLIFKVRAEDVSVGCEGLSFGAFTCGVAGGVGGIPLEIETETGVKSVAVTKLPTGMKYDAKAGLITGAPTKAGTYEVTVTVTTKSGAKQIVTIPVTVVTLPVTAVGTFNGFVKAEDGEENIGTFTLTTTDAGKLTAKVTTAAGSYSFSGTCWEAVEDGVYSATLATKKGETLTLSLDSAAGWNANQLTGEFAALSPKQPRQVVARKNAFGKTWFFKAEGNESTGWTLSFAENAKVAALTVTLNADGSTKIAGKLGALNVNASGYADVTGLSGGVIFTDFAPVVSVKDGKATVKRILSIRANLWFDRSDNHAEGVGTVKLMAPDA